MASTSGSTALATTNAPVVVTGAPPALAPWRDPHTVPAHELARYIQQLETACLAEPRSAHLRTCLGVAHAMNYDVDKSMDALEAAVTLDAGSFWARLKYAELHFRIRALNRAEAETLAALALAGDRWQLSIARKQLQDIRAHKQGCVRNVEWTKPLTMPALVLVLMLAAIFATMAWR